MTNEETLVLDDEHALSRFWDKINIPFPNDPDACWEWTAYQDKNGCGRFMVYIPWRNNKNKYKAKRAPRIMWIIEHEQDIPEGMQVLHSCDQESCCNPKHLKLGTPYDNMQDRKARGRYDTNVKGEKHPKSKLKAKQVVQICKDFHHHQIGISTLSRKYKVSTRVIRDIITGVSWKHTTKNHLPKVIRLDADRRKELREKMYNLYDNGMSPAQIAKKYKMNTPYVRRLICKERRRRGEKTAHNINYKNRKKNEHS